MDFSLANFKGSSGIQLPKDYYPSRVLYSPSEQCKLWLINAYVCKMVCNCWNYTVVVGLHNSSQLLSTTRCWQHSSELALYNRTRRCPTNQLPQFYVPVHSWHYSGLINKEYMWQDRYNKSSGNQCTGHNW